MKNTPLSPHSSVSIPRGALHILQTAHQCRRLRVEAGTLWVTLGMGPHHPEATGADFFLTAGHELCVQPAQRVLVEPVGDPPTREGARYQWLPTR